MRKRVLELAKELGVKPRELLDRSSAVGIKLASTFSVLKPEIEEAVRALIVGRSRATLEPSIELRVPDAPPCRIKIGQQLKGLAQPWAYAVRQRRRWLATTDGKTDLQSRAESDILSFGATPEILDAIAQSGVAEVGIPFSDEKTDWEARIFPWEYVLSAATKSRRGEGRSLTVVRHLVHPETPPTRPEPESLLIVESAPGPFASLFAFDSERRLVLSALDLASKSVKICPQPTLETLRQQIRKVRPDIVHLTGTDAHEGAELLGLPADPKRWDGFYMVDQHGRPSAETAQDLAASLTDGHRPRLVVFNTYYSAGRLAALAVAAGAGAAIGFQDDIDDAAAELILVTFYRAWKASGFQELAALQVALDELRRQAPGARGAGVVLWSERSLIAPGAGEATSSVRFQIEQQRQQPLAPTTTGTGGIADILSAEVRVPPRLNYALLHNDGDVLEMFLLRKSLPGRLLGVEVDVVLRVGAQEFPYRARLDLEKDVTSLQHDVRLPLTWDLLRQLRESVKTSLFVSVRYDGQEIYRRTHILLLDPPTEWKDSKTDAIWLPSFVLPRDPAIPGIVDRAQRYLSSLADDRYAGFDGYQSIEPRASDPCEGVDNQVRAIWWALVLDHDLNYVNPPPSYAKQCQRLRTPSEVLQERRGTCLDLALLMAACMESIDLSPALFLIPGHAFPAYWRSETAQRNFWSTTALFERPTEEDGWVKTPGAAGGEWMIGKAEVEKVRSCVRRGDLVPLESVALTEKAGFEDGIERGLQNLQGREGFDAFLDVRRARDGSVTPLPL